MTESECCTWCEASVDHADGFRARKDPGARGAVFCRLEHVVPWAMQGARWGAAGAAESPVPGKSPDTCAHCGQPLTDSRVILIRHRGEHRIPDAFCSVDHMARWANAGGRYAR